MMDASASIPLKAVVRRTFSRTVIEVSGDLDFSTVSTFTEHYALAKSTLSKISDPQTLVLDLRNLNFIDSSGLFLLVGIHQEVATTPHVLSVVVREHSQPQRVIALDRYDKMLNVTSELDEAP